MKTLRNAKGFTLIELLIVVAIIGILAAIAIPQYIDYTRRARISEVTHSMGAIKNAIIAYYTDKADGPVAYGNAAAINTNIGVGGSTQYAEYAVSDCSNHATPCTITATFNDRIAAAFSGLTITLETSDYQVWRWNNQNSDTMEAKYIPKN